VTTPGLHPALEPIDTLDWARVDAFLGQRIAEDERLDYKDRVAPSFAETAAAMANGRGGTIVVGVRETDPPNVPGTWDGVTGDVQGAARNTVWSYCSPAISMRLAPLENPQTRNALLVAAVAPANLPPVWHRDHGVLVRSGDQNRPASPELLEAWYRARSEGNPSEVALRRRVNAATMYGAPGFNLHVWPVAAIPPSQFRPETDLELDRLAATALERDTWTGYPHGNEYVLEASRDDRALVTGVAQQGFVRSTYVAVVQPPAVEVDLVDTAADLLREYARRLVFAELALERVCSAPPPFRVEVVMNYGSSWRVAPPESGLEFTDPVLPGAPSVETPATVEATMAARGASGASQELLVGTLRRLRWRHFDSVMRYLTGSLPARVETLYDRLGA